MSHLGEGMDATLQTVIAQLGVAGVIVVLLWYLLRTFIPNMQARHDRSTELMRQDFLGELKEQRAARDELLDTIRENTTATREMVAHCAARAARHRSTDAPRPAVRLAVRDEEEE